MNDYRNPLVAEALRVMKYVNKFNRGVTRVQEMLKDNGNPPAEFDVNTITAFRVNVHATNESDLSKGTSQGTSQTDKTVDDIYANFKNDSLDSINYFLFHLSKNLITFATSTSVNLTGL